MQGRPGCSSDGNRPLVGADALLAAQLPRQTPRTNGRLQQGSPGFPRDMGVRERATSWRVRA